MQVEINGIKYQRKEQNNSQPKKYNKSFSMLYGMAMMFSAQGSLGTSRYERPTSKVDLIKEFELIQLKKSLLLKKDRDWVVSQFNRNFYAVS